MFYFVNQKKLNIPPKKKINIPLGIFKVGIFIMFSFIQSLFLNKEKSFTPLQTIVVVSYNNTKLKFNTKNIIWPPNN